MHHALVSTLHRLMCGLLMAVSALCLNAQTAAPVSFTHPGLLLPDSSNFVTASLLVISPGPNPVSAMGHSAIRLECPTHELDYCFTLENNPEYGLLTFILGKAPTHDIAVKTEDFLKEFIAENRQVIQYELNLTLHEKQELWRAADIEFTHVGDRLFNYSYDGTDNCTSICFELIERSLIDEQIVVDTVPSILLENNGTYLRHMSRRSPWVRFMLMTLGGSACDETWNMRNRMAPEVIIPLLSHSHFEGESGTRPVLNGNKKELVHGKFEMISSPATPLLVFGCLLVIAIIITMLQRYRLGSKIARIFDVGLLLFQTLVGLFLITTSSVGSIVGAHWNWYLIPFNPLPLLIWLFCRKRKRYPRVFYFYAIVLVLFLLATPFSSQLDVEHQLITATLLVRTIAAIKNNSCNEKTSQKTSKKAHKSQK